MKLETNFLPADLIKYLDKYSLPGWNLELNNNSRYTAAVVIPAISEYDNIKKLLFCLSNNDRQYFNDTLVLFVINNTVSSKEEDKQNNNLAIELIRNIINCKSNDDNFIRGIISSGLNIGLVDASSAGRELPEKDGGVGLARKIAMDLALIVMNYESGKNPFLVCLDADCKVERNYITELHNMFSNQKVKSAFINFEHIPEGSDEHKSAIICYEIYIRYYVLCLKLAGSHFAFHTIGSTMACSCQNYIKTEGMNKRKAGEDFYFMEKLAKISSIDYIKNTTVYPSSRVSWRVPFGTGQKVNKLLSEMKSEFLLYSLDSFLVLKSWLEVFNNGIYSASLYLNEARNIHVSLYNFLIENNFEENWERILRNSKTEEQVNKQKIFWFDGFRTMKFIHYLRDNGIPLAPMFESLDGLFRYYKFKFNSERGKDSVPLLNMQYNYLLKLRELELLVF